MESKLFADFKKVLKKDGVPGASVVKTTLKHANKAQTKQLLELFPALYRENKKGDVVAQSRKAGDKAAATTLAAGEQVVLTSNLTLGTYGHEPAAQEEARQFMHPEVFKYRSSLFPNPINHGVVVRVKEANPVQLQEPASPLYPWSLEVIIEVEGKAAKVNSWYQKFEGRIRPIRVI